MRQIWKFPLNSSVISLPKGAKFLCVQNQNDRPCMWFEVDTEAEEEKREFKIVGTGHDLKGEMVYLGTVQNPPYVWHAYEKVGDEKPIRTARWFNYRRAIEWIAINDEPRDMDPKSIAGFISATLVADLFGVSTGKVGRDVKKYREKAQ